MKIYDKDELIAYLSETMHIKHTGISEYVFSNIIADKYIVPLVDHIIPGFMYISSSVKQFKGKDHQSFYTYVNQIEYLPVCMYVTIKYYDWANNSGDKCLHIYSEDSYKIIEAFDDTDRSRFEKNMIEFKSSGLTADEFIFKKRGILKSKKYGF